MKRSTSLVCLVMCSVLLSVPGVNGQSKSKPQAIGSENYPTGTPSATLSNINRIAAWYNSNGIQEEYTAAGSAGLTFPRQTAMAVFTSGLMWGGIFNDGRTPALRVNGQSYRTGMKPGAILGLRTGVAEDPNAPDVRIWRIREDYATANLRMDAAEINDIPVANVTQAQVDGVRNQYATDWAEWPWHKGAPFYDVGYLDPGGNLVGASNGILDWGEDQNRNGSLEPGEDLNGNGKLDAESPGLLDADQVLWSVCNDIGVAQPWESPESGIEEQTTVWAYNRLDFMGNVIFKRLRLIYKGVAATPVNATIDNMYLCQFSDLDLGSFSNDFAGCDTVLNLGYVYNAVPNDVQYAAFGLTPPAVGHDLLQGPIVNTGNPADTAIFNFRKVPGAKNVPMTSFFAHTSGGVYSDPPFNYSGAIQWYQMLRAYPPTPQGPPDPARPIDPITGEPVIFHLWGDPVAGTGWIDGILDGPGNRGYLINTGPFSVAVGDTQEIVIGVIADLGPNNLLSVAALKQVSRNVQTVYDELFTIAPPPVWVNVTYPASSEATIKITADGNPASAQSINTTLKRQNEATHTAVQLFDDGLHGDGDPNDGIFANSVTVGRELDGLFLDAEVTDNAARTFTWERVYDRIPIAGPVLIRSWQIFSDNLNSDGMANSGENIRYGFTTVNGSSFSLSGVVITPAFEPDSKFRQVATFGTGAIDSMVYDPSNPQSYFTVNIPAGFVDSLFNLPISVTDGNSNRWVDTISIPVYPLTIRQAQITHAGGLATGSFEISVVDSFAVNNHLYAIYGINEPGGTLSFTLRDSTTGTVLLSNHPFPDSLGHNIPATDGFKVLQGTIETDWGWDSWSVPQGSQVWTWDSANGLNLEGFNGAMSLGYGNWFSSSSAPPYRASNVLIKFAATDANGNLINPMDTTASFAYRYVRLANLQPARPEFAPFIINTGPGYAYQEYQRSIPFAAYDMNSVPPRRLMVGHVENNAFLGRVDGKYWPPVPGPLLTGGDNIHTFGPREWFFIFDLDYSEIPDPVLQVDIENDTVPLMWWGTPNRIGNVSFQAGDQFVISARFPYTSHDVWTFNPTILVSVPWQEVPTSFRLYQNYPNPFNPTTTLQYSLPAASIVTLKVYNVLGQEIKILVDGVRSAGGHIVQWDARNSAGSKVASGVYFYRIDATGLSDRSSRFLDVKKMLLLK